jgi:hypothetical protein
LREDQPGNQVASLQKRRGGPQSGGAAFLPLAFAGIASL